MERHPRQMFAMSQFLASLGGATGSFWRTLKCKRQKQRSLLQSRAEAPAQINQAIEDFWRGSIGGYDPCRSPSLDPILMLAMFYHGCLYLIKYYKVFHCSLLTWRWQGTF